MTPRRHGKKLRSQRLAGTDPQEPLEGNCVQMSHPCGEEAACVQLRENDYQCICPHDNSVPTRDLRCPNRRKVTEKPRPMVVIPPTGSHPNVTNSTLPAELESGLLKEGGGVWGLETATLVAGGLLGSLLLLGLMALSICCYSNYTRRARLHMKDNPHSHSHPLSLSTPVSLTKGVIDAQRFAANPEYVGADLYPLTLPTIPREDVIFRHVIGEGCFGKVYKGEVQRPEDGGLLQTVAIKVLKDSASKEAEEDFMREVEIMAGFHHPNILSLIGVALKQVGKSPWMVFEFMPHGDLTEVLRSNAKHFSKPDSNAPKLNQESLLLIATQIACGMKYLAGQHFVHRDLACRNCLVGANLTVKIADFGMSRDVYTCDYYKIGGSRLLPVRWMSPESVTYGRFTLESDVWSYGVVLWEIYTLGKQPYYGHSNEQVVRLILEGKALVPPDDCSPLISGLMTACWAPEPRDRLTFPQVYERLLRGGSPLPRPPPILVTPTPQVEDYLCPHPRPPHHYLQPLPD